MDQRVNETVTEEKIIVRRMPDDSGYGWMVLWVPNHGRKAGVEHCLAMLCGGNMGKVLAGICAKQAAEMKMVDIVEIED